METNQYFNPKRFWHMLQNDFLINHKAYVFTFLGGLILVYLFYYMILPSNDLAYPIQHHYYVDSLFVCLLGLGAFAGMSFPNLNDKIKATSYLMIPSSTFEKYLAQFLIRIVLSSLLFLLIIWMDTHLVRWTYLLAHPKVDPTQFAKFRLSDLLLLYVDKPNSLTLYAFCLAIGAYLFAVRLFFGRFAVVKSILSLLAVYILMLCLMVLYTKIFYPQMMGFNMQFTTYKTNILGLNNTMLWILSLSLSTLGLLPLGYFKLKEKQP